MNSDSNNHPASALLYAEPVFAHTEVFIAGAGPAGLACAIALARKGLSVHIADGMTPPIDKACGEGLMPDTLLALEALGIDVDATAGSSKVDSSISACIRGIRFLDSDSGRTTEARFPARDGRGMKRRALYLLLLDRAVELGVQFSWETVVLSCSGSVVATNRGPIHARFIVGADGHQSRIRVFRRARERHGPLTAASASDSTSRSPHGPTSSRSTGATTARPMSRPSPPASYASPSSPANASLAAFQRHSRTSRSFRPALRKPHRPTPHAGPSPSAASSTGSRGAT